MAKYQSKRALRKSKLKKAERKLQGLCPECGLDTARQGHKTSCLNAIKPASLYGIVRSPAINITGARKIAKKYGYR